MLPAHRRSPTCPGTANTSRPWSRARPAVMRVPLCSGASRTTTPRLSPLMIQEVAVAMVGTRRCSAYALEMGEKLAFQMAGLGAVIVSGLASGGDAAAHRGALRAGGFTAAVIGGKAGGPRSPVALPQDRRRCGGYVEGFAFRLHRDADRLAAGGEGVLAQSPALAAQKDDAPAQVRLPEVHGVLPRAGAAGRSRH